MHVWQSTLWNTTAFCFLHIYWFQWFDMRMIEMIIFNKIYYRICVLCLFIFLNSKTYVSKVSTAMEAWSIVFGNLTFTILFEQFLTCCSAVVTLCGGCCNINGQFVIHSLWYGMYFWIRIVSNTYGKHKDSHPNLPHQTHQYPEIWMWMCTGSSNNW